MLKNSKHALLYSGLAIHCIIFLYATSVFASIQLTLSWTAPTTNEDGTYLTDLAGYKVYYGTESGNYHQSADVGNVTIYQFFDDSGGLTHFFAVTAYDTSGNESRYSHEVSMIIPSLPTPFEESCNDGIDNDQDGLIDCNDTDCEGQLCNDIQYCSVGETCQGGVCTGGGPLDCDDGVGCTDDSCNEETDSCDNVPNDAYCSDDGEFCNGDEYCDPLIDCTATGTPCAPGEICNAGLYECQEAYCESDAYCDDGLFCNGAETCNLATGHCEAGIQVSCNDGDICTDNYCNEVTDTCDNVMRCEIVEVQVGAGSDDAEESLFGSITLVSSDLELVHRGSNQTVGMRFNNIDIPQGEVITNAYIQFQVDEVSTGGATLTIQGEAIDNALTFRATSDNISGRALTGATVEWAPSGWLTVGESGPDQQTPNMASIIQEIVDRAGWLQGNSLVIIITGTGRRTAESYDGSQSGAPKLYVEFSSGQ